MFFRKYIFVFLCLLLISPAARANDLSHVWSYCYGDTNSHQAHSVAVDDFGNVVITGGFSGTVDFGGGTLTSTSEDIFVTKFDSSGSHIWSHNFGDSTALAHSVAVDDSGNVVITGEFVGTVDFGGGTLTSAGSNDIFVAMFDSNGVHLWSQRFGDAGYEIATSIAVDDLGNVIVAGWFYGTVDFGGGLLTSAGNEDFFVAKFDPGGTHLWSDRFGDTGAEQIISVAVDDVGEIVITGEFYGTVDFGGGALTGAGSVDIFLAKFDPDGTHIWSQRFGGSDAETGYSVAVDGLGNVIIAGWFWDTVDFGGGPLTSAGLSDIFVAKFDPGGTHIWSQRFGDADNENAISVAVDYLGNVIVAGFFWGTVDFGGGTLTSAGWDDIFVTKLDPGGAHVWSQRFGDSEIQIDVPAYEHQVCAGTDGLGNVIVAGYFWGTVDFGGGPCANTDDYEDIFVVKFAPTDSVICHDGIWHLGEFCGYDAYQTTGIGEMNHDCYVNLMDLQLFAYDYIQVGPNISGDLNGDNICNLVDLAHFALGWQDSVPNCTRSGMLPDAAQGSIAISFSSDSTTIVPVDTAAVGWVTAYVVIDGYGDVGSVEYTIETSSNLKIYVHERQYSSAFSGYDWVSFDPDRTHSYKATVPTSPLPAGPINIGYILLHHTDTRPGWIRLVDFQWPGWHDCYLRWNNVAANRTYYFAEVSHAEVYPPIGVGVDDVSRPADIALHQNIPNPFNPMTVISFTLPERVSTNLSIFNLEGKRVTTLLDEMIDEGLKEVAWDGTDANGSPVSSGVYFYRLRAGKEVLTRKMVLLK